MESRLGPMAASTASALEPSALTSFIASSVPSDVASDADKAQLHALALQVLHNLRYQHEWHSLEIHPESTSPVSTASPPRPLISGIPPRRIYTHPDMQIELIKKGLTEEDVEPERVYVIPSMLREKWSLRTFSECFKAMPTPYEERQRQQEGQAHDENAGRQWPGDDVKRALLATVDDDSTVVYYVVHDGIVKPRQN